MNGYQLTRRWYNYKFGNPDKVRHIHSDMYFYIVDLWNRLGQKEKIGLPTSVTMEALGIGSYNTYKKALAELIEFGFIVEVSEAKNQHQSRVIALSINDKATNRALDSAISISDESPDETPAESLAEPTDKAPDSIIEEKELITIEEGNSVHPLQLFILKFFPFVSEISTQLTYKNCEALLEKFPRDFIVEKLEAMENKSGIESTYTSVFITLKKWCTEDLKAYLSKHRKLPAYKPYEAEDYQKAYNEFSTIAEKRGIKIPTLSNT